MHPAFYLPVPFITRIEIPAYFLLLTIGLGSALVLTVRDGARQGMDRERLIDTNIWMSIWGLIGARALHVIADGHFHDYVNLCRNPKLVPAIDALVERCQTAKQCGYDYLCDAMTHKCYPPKDCFAAFEIWRGGLAYYGGFLAATAFALYYVRKYKLGWWRTADLASPGIMLGLFFGRVGCYLNGCCWGKVTTSRWGVIFPRGSLAWRSQYDAHLISRAAQMLPVHCTQLYEAVACLAIFVFLYFCIRPRKQRQGEVFAWMLMLYAIARSLVEMFRDDDRGVFFGGHLSTSQLLSIPLFLVGAILYGRLRGR